jgi:hypothetical protein
VLASIVAFWAGEFVNSYVMARMKIWTQGAHLWSRTIGSTVVGQGVDSLIFYPLAFWGVWENDAVVTVMVTNWGLKVIWEVVLTPVTYMRCRLAEAQRRRRPVRRRHQLHSLQNAGLNHHAFRLYAAGFPAVQARDAGLYRVSARMPCTFMLEWGCSCWSG